MQIPVDKVKIFDADIIRKALPKGYWLGKRGDIFTVFRGELAVARAFIKDGMVNFEAVEDQKIAWATDAFQKALNEKWADLSDDSKGD